MSLAPGVRLGSYEIISKIGEGDPERLARFQREAHLLASLNHPHIAAIYGLEEGSQGQEGRDGKAPDFLVMELVEGEDLSQRIARGAMPLDEALPIGKQIAEALEGPAQIGRRDLSQSPTIRGRDQLVRRAEAARADALSATGSKVPSRVWPSLLPSSRP